MIDENLEELISAYVLGALEPEEAAALESRLTNDRELQHAVDEMQETAARLAYAAPSQPLPADLEKKILREIGREPKLASIRYRGRGPSRWFPWTIAAAALFAGAIVALDNAALKKQIASVESHVAEAKAESAAVVADRYRAANQAAQNAKRLALAETQIEKLNADRKSLAEKIAQLEESEGQARAELATQRTEIAKAIQIKEQSFSQMQVANLTSKMEKAPQASAVIIWDSEKQQGVLKLLNMPPCSPEQSYQLWMVDPKYKQPVSAGVFNVEASKATKIVFRPKQRIASVNAFAVSLERKGGAEKAEGPMVLMGKL